ATHGSDSIGTWVFFFYRPAQPPPTFAIKRLFSRWTFTKITAVRILSQLIPATFFANSCYEVVSLVQQLSRRRSTRDQDRRVSVRCRNDRRNVSKICGQGRL